MTKEKNGNNSSFEKIIEYFKECGNFTQTADQFSKNRSSLSKKIKKNLDNWEFYQKTKKDKIWTEEEIKCLSQYPKLSLLKISEKLGRSYGSVKAKALREGLSCENNAIAAKESAKRNNNNIWNKEKIISYLLVIKNTVSTHSEALEKYPQLYDAACRYFGSWKKALKYCKIDYNELRQKTISNYKSLYRALDNNYYDSKIEGVIANALFLLKKVNLIKNYTPHKQVVHSRKWSCDFYVEFNDKSNLWIEYDGLKNCRPQRWRYDEKISFYKQNKFNYVVLTSKKKAISFLLEKVGRQNELEEWMKREHMINSLFNEKYELYKKDLLKDVVNVKNLLNHVPSTTEYSQYGKYSVHTLYRNIGSWQKVLKDANLWHNYKKKYVSIEKVKIIKKKLSEKENCKKISEEMNVSLAIVKHIYYGSRWKNVSI